MFLSLFLDPKERRLRALWRIVLTLGIYVVTNIGFSLMAGIAVMAFLPEEIDAARLSGDSAAYEKLLNDFFLNNPVTGMINTAAVLLGVFATLWLAARFLDRRSIEDYGLRSDGRWWKELLAGLGIGAASISAVAVILILSGTASVEATLASTRPQVNFAFGIAEYILLFIGVGINEELLFRGFFLKNISEGLRLKFGNRPALLAAAGLSSAVFGLVHLGNPNATVFSAISIFLAGLLLAIPYLWTGQIGLSIGLHITWNLFQGVVFGLPVSGTRVPENLISLSTRGPDWWSGGAFGPEGGLVGILGIMAAFLLVILYVQKSRGKPAIDLSINDYQIMEADADTLRKEPKNAR